MSLPSRVHMVGIGGVGMSALAQLLVHRGSAVSGSDREESPMTELLARQGLTLFIGHDACIIPADTELLVFSDAIPADNPERTRARDMGIPEMSYFQALGEVSRGMRTIAVSGTHGKTTTTGMLASILKAAGKEPTAIVGSIVPEWGSNFLAGANDLLVVEACEYKNHLLELSPEILVVTNVEWDHTDFFPDLAAVQETFAKAAARVPVRGIIVADTLDAALAPILSVARAQVVNYGEVQVPELLLLGEFNRENARAAKAAALAAFPDMNARAADAALAVFRGTARRFEFKGENGLGAALYDDYAHHPTAIEATLKAAREKFPGKRIVVAFHPHLYSRTRDLLSGFVEALAHADRVFVAPIYAAREREDTAISSAVLARALQDRGGSAEALDFEGIRAELSKLGPEAVIITMGAGDIYKLAEQVVTG